MIPSKGESPETTGALLLRLLSHRRKVLKGVLMRGDEGLGLRVAVRTQEDSWQD